MLEKSLKQKPLSYKYVSRSTSATELK